MWGKWLCLNFWLFVSRAFDTLTKVLQSEEGCGEEGAVRVDEQTTALLELEGPLLSDMHVPFKVRRHCWLAHTAVTTPKMMDQWQSVLNIVCSWWCRCPCLTSWIWITSVNQLLVCFSSQCTGHALFQLSRPLGECINGPVYTGFRRSQVDSTKYRCKWAKNIILIKKYILIYLCCPLCSETELLAKIVFFSSSCVQCTV